MNCVTLDYAGTIRPVPEQVEVPVDKTLGQVPGACTKEIRYQVSGYLPKHQKASRNAYLLGTRYYRDCACNGWVQIGRSRYWTSIFDAQIRCGATDKYLPPYLSGSWTSASTQYLGSRACYARSESIPYLLASGLNLVLGQAGKCPLLPRCRHLCYHSAHHPKPPGLGHPVPRLCVHGHLHRLRDSPVHFGIGALKTRYIRPPLSLASATETQRREHCRPATSQRATASPASPDTVPVFLTLDSRHNGLRSTQGAVERSGGP